MRALLLAIALLAAGPAVGESLQLESLDGSAVTLAAPPGVALVVHFWATWCPSCRGELSDLDRAARACDGRTTQVVAVDVGEDAATVRAFLGERQPLALPVLLDRDGRVWRRSGGREMPANLIWTAAGRSWSFGPSSAQAWRDRLTGLGCAASPDVE
jgi:thiol-disulfide isomerase/thioredoxin